VAIGTLLNRLLRPLNLALVRGARGRGEYTPNPPYGSDTYSPWLTDAFQADQEAIASHTLVSADRRYVLETLARQARHLPGEFSECGVYRGGTAYLLASVIGGGRQELHLFDTFAGMPPSADADPSGHREGDFGDTSLPMVREYLAPFPSVVFHPGFIPDTFAPLPADIRFSLVHVDVDLYQSVRDTLEFFYPRIVPGGMMVFDDYGFEMYRDAARRAVDEFFGDRPEVPLVLRTGQCVVHRLGRGAGAS